MTATQTARVLYEAYAKAIPEDLFPARLRGMAWTDWENLPAAEQRAYEDAVQAVLAAEAPDVAEQAIGLFLEYRDVHGHDEDSARAAAVREVAEGASVTRAEIALAAEETYPSAVRGRRHRRNGGPVTACPYSIGSGRWPGLAKLAEECGEVIQVIGKIIAANGESAHWDGTDLRQRLEDEIADMQAAAAFLVTHSGLDSGRVTSRAAGKLTMFEHWHRDGVDGSIRHD